MDPRLPIRSIDYSVIFVRQMRAMRDFYGSTPFLRDPDGNVLEIDAEIEPTQAP